MTSVGQDTVFKHGGVGVGHRSHRSPLPHMGSTNLSMVAAAPPKAQDVHGAGEPNIQRHRGLRGRCSSALYPFEPKLRRFPFYKSRTVDLVGGLGAIFR